MELTFLGTSAGAPTKDRNVAGVALRIDGRWDLFDCGEATQHQLLRTQLSLFKLHRIFISHLHGDHCFGLFGLLASRSMDGAAPPLTVFGPPGLRAMIETVLSTSSTHLVSPVNIHEVDPAGERVIDADEMTIDAIPLTHRVTSMAWFVQEADRPGHFDVEAARSTGVPEGRLFGQLQRGQAVDLDDGRRVESREVTGPIRLGRRIVIAGDNSAPAALFERTGGADVVVHEATYTEPVLTALGNDHGHGTAARVAQAAQSSGVRNLVLTHFSPRYGHSNTSTSSGLTVDDVRDEARQHFDGGLHLANDFDRIEVSHDGSTINLMPEAP